MRHRAHSPAYTTLNESQGNAPELSEILDISEEGMSIQMSSPLEIEHDLSLCLDLSETRALIHTTGHLVWSDTAGRAGIRFLRLSPQSLDQLKEWLFVNVLTAFDHAGETSYNWENWNGASNHLLPSHTMPGGDLLSGPLLISGNGGASEDGSTSVRTNGNGNRVNREIEVKIEAEPNRFGRENTLQSIAERALTLTRATGAAIALSEGNDGEMTCVASAGEDAPPLGSHVQTNSGFSGECVRTGRSLRCDDSETDDRVDREGCRSLGIRSIVAVPIRQGTKVAGLVEVFSPNAYAFNAEDIATLQGLSAGILSKPLPAVEVRVEAEPDSVTAVASASPARVVPVELEQRPAPVEKRPAPEFAVAAATPVVPSAAPTRPASQVNVQRVLLVAAIGTFVFAVAWLIAPWVSNAMRSSQRTQAHTQTSAQPSMPKSPSLPAGVTDLASLRRVAEQGDPAAQFSLGARYATGEGVTQDYTEAVRWFTQAAEQGHILAQATLGAYYWAGRGVSQDLTKAYYWSVLAQAGGDQASKYRVAVLTSRMSRGQVVAAQQQADDWLRTFAGRAPVAR